MISFERATFERLLQARPLRRNLLLGLGAIAGSALIRPLVAGAIAADGRVFSLGVASGEPLPDGVVLWTRLAPNPLVGGGMAPRRVEVRWQVARDENMRRIVKQGVAQALPEWGHSLHVEVRGLESDRPYWYRFQTSQETSPIGRTRTAPASGARVERLRFAFASCQNYEQGYFTAYRDMAQADLNFVVHLGDYIYEGGAIPGRPRLHDGSEATALDHYRNRYALYKMDPDLQAAHAAFPWIVTWDDHEVDNNYAGGIPEDSQGPEEFMRRRSDAYQAYYEHMPLRRPPVPGGGLPLYRRLRFGDLAELNVLDTRQYRSDQPCGDRLKPRCAGALAAAATMMGQDQERWLLQGLDHSSARWNVIAQQTVMGQFDVDPTQTELYNLDQWDGYVAARDRLLKFLGERRPANPVVLSGDIHSNWVFDLKTDFGKPDSPVVATEFVGTSISSDFSKEFIAQIQAALPGNPHARFFEGAYRGYTLCQLTPKRWQTDLRVVSNAREPNSAVTTLASFVVEDGKPGARRL